MAKFMKRKDGRAVARGKLPAQQLIHHDAKIARAFEKVVEVAVVSAGETLIRQKASDDDLYFIFSGSLEIRKNNRPTAIRSTGCHVGEMSLVTKAARSATVVACEDSIVAKVSEKDFTKIANNHPILWRRLAIETSNRLMEVTDHVKPRNLRPQVFIGSSTERIGLAKALKTCLSSKDWDITVWNKDIFRPSHTALAALTKTADDFDFAVFLFHPDDKVVSRKRLSRGPRDNVIFEAGLFVGALGVDRTFVMCPKNFKSKIPSDLAGYSLVPYATKKGISLEAMVCDGAELLKREIRNLGPK